MRAACCVWAWSVSYRGAERLCVWREVAFMHLDRLASFDLSIDHSLVQVQLLCGTADALVQRISVFGDALEGEIAPSQLEL